ncbi:flagellar biosynthesis anti-sigma factor FlgM [Effusibacillus pohliae]|uniref:flagellar biosynthesis anti-sigma factor FlgM n=1 Tax=Effusibacillus pohliae TaxID=232270 RepID=UPI00036717FF|nr:flagellar biosynthesis anti-sigma factor FlgM [Effusibacillus pohliae]
MKINGDGRIHPLQPYQRNSGLVKAGQAGARGSSRDELSISLEALQMAQSGPPIDPQQRTEHAEKVQRIKQAVQNGTYEIDARKVADKIARYLLGE